MQLPRSALIALTTALCFLSTDTFATSESLSPSECAHSNNWRCRGNLYLTVAAGLSHTFYKDQEVSLTLPNGSSILYTVSKAFPNNFAALSFSFGYTLHEHFSAEFVYSEQFSKTHDNGVVQIAKSAKSLIVALSYTLNPQDRLHFGISAGASAAANITTVTVDGSGFNVTSIVADINPQMGLGAAYQLNAHFALRATTAYQFAVNNRSAKSAIIGLVGLSYFP